MNWKHKPLTKPSDEWLGEGIYAAAWQRAIEDNSGLIASVMIDVGDWTTWDTRIIAPWMQWAGSTEGGAFFKEVEALASHIPAGHERQRQDFFLATWSVKNKRRRHVNRGFRLLELLTTPEEGRDESGFPRSLSITPHDFETADQAIYWLGSDAGLKFLRATEAHLSEVSKKTGRPARGPMVIIEEALA